MDSDGFQLVKSKRNRPNNSKRTNLLKPSSLETSCHKTACIEDVQDLHKKITDCKSQLKLYDRMFYWSKVQLAAHKLFNSYFEFPSTPNSSNSVIHIICYGLGSVEENLSSRYQLALLLLLIEEVQLFNENKLNSKLELGLIEFYDPVFNSVDKQLLVDTYGFKISLQNDQCFRLAENTDSDNKVMTLFYMPHCGKAMYNNLLFTNWSMKQLKSLVILGNLIYY